MTLDVRSVMLSGVLCRDEAEAAAMLRNVFTTTTVNGIVPASLSLRRMECIRRTDHDYPV